MKRAPLREVERIYDWVGAELTDLDRRAMMHWLAENSRAKRSLHEYTLKEFGYSDEGLAADFREYRERHVLSG